MDDLLQNLEDLLTHERQAAIDADVERLEALQEEKRARVAPVCSNPDHGAEAQS